MRLGGVVAMGLLTAGLLALPGAARAQAVWDGPMLVSPKAAAGWGLHLVDPHPADGIGGLVTWRANPAPVGLGFRVGVVEGWAGDAALVMGVDAAGSIYHVEEPDFDMDVMWFAGGGVGIDEWTTLSFPLGIAVGWAFEDDEVAFRPFVAPRIVLDAFLGDNRLDGNDGVEMGFAAEVGMDFAFDPRFGIRAAGSFGDREAISIGVTVPGLLEERD